MDALGLVSFFPLTPWEVSRRLSLLSPFSFFLSQLGVLQLQGRESQSFNKFDYCWLIAFAKNPPGIFPRAVDGLMIDGIVFPFVRKSQELVKMIRSVLLEIESSPII